MYLCLTPSCKQRTTYIKPFRQYLYTCIFPRRIISLLLLIMMAHNLHIGQKLEDFAAF